MLTVKAVAAELNISVAAAYALIHSGDLRAVNLAPSDKPGERGLWRVTRECLSEFLRQRLTPSRVQVEQQPLHPSGRLRRRAIPNLLDS